MCICVCIHILNKFLSLFCAKNLSAFSSTAHCCAATNSSAHTVLIKNYIFIVRLLQTMLIAHIHSIIIITFIMLQLFSYFMYVDWCISSKNLSSINSLHAKRLNKVKYFFSILTKKYSNHTHINNQLYYCCCFIHTLL